MAEEFDKNAAATRHDAIIKDVQWIRDGLTKDVIDYYYNSYPDSTEAEQKQHAEMRKYLDLAWNRINDLLKGKLYS
jgi:hypothetical protein